MGCTNDVLDEFQSKKLLPTEADPLDFVSPQWGTPEKPTWFLLYRVTMAILIPLWVCADFVFERTKFFQGNAVWFIYATNWAFILLGVSNVLHCIIVVQHYLKASQHQIDDLPALYSVFWCIYNISSNCILIVSVSFWVFMAFLVTQEYMSSNMSELKHSLSGVFVILDLLLTRTPIRFLHFIYPVMLGLMYTGFNALYFLNNGQAYDGKPYTYYVLYWKRPTEAIATTILETLLAIIMQLFLVLIYKLRLWVHSRIQQNEAEHYDKLCDSCSTLEELHLLDRVRSNDGSQETYESMQN